MKKLLFVLLIMLPIFTCAQIVEIDSIYYNLSTDTKEAVYKSNEKKSAEIVISEIVNYKGIDYRVTSIDDYAFSDNNILISVIIPNSVTYIGYNAFEGDQNLTSVHLSENLENIHTGTFKGCEKLQSIKMPNKIKRIFNRAFYGCKNLKTIYLPESLESIGSEVFIGCENITDIYCLANERPPMYGRVFDESTLNSATLHVPASLLETYKNNIKWGKFEKIVPLKK